VPAVPAGGVSATIVDPYRRIHLAGSSIGIPDQANQWLWHFVARHYPPGLSTGVKLFMELVELLEERSQASGCRRPGTGPKLSLNQ